MPPGMRLAACTITGAQARGWVEETGPRLPAPGESDVATKRIDKTNIEKIADLEATQLNQRSTIERNSASSSTRATQRRAPSCLFRVFMSSSSPRGGARVFFLVMAARPFPRECAGSTAVLALGSA